MSDISSHSTLTTNLVSYWELEEASGTRVDSHSSNDLSEINTVGQATGIIGNGADLERGNLEYLRSTASALRLTGDQAISMWVKVEDQVTSGAIEYQLYNRYLPSGNNRAIAYTYIYNGGSYSLQVITSSSGSTIAFGNIAQTLTPGSWYHLVFNYDASVGAVEIFVNGSSIGTIGGQYTSIYSGTAPTEIGAQNGNYTFDGVIDEVGIWSKVLSSSEIADLYNSGSGLPYSAGGGGGYRFVPQLTPFAGL